MQRGSSLAGQTAAVQLAGADGEGDSRGQQSGSEYMPQSESDSVSNSSSSSSSLASEEWGMSDAERSEAVSGGRQRRGSRGGRRQVSRANSAVAPSAAATAAASASARHIESSSEQSVYAPYSNLLWCDSALQRGALPVSRLLCTDIAGFSGNEGVAPVQVTLLIHTASWDVQQHIRSQLQLEGAAGEQQGQDTAVTDSTPVKQFGPYEATLQQRGKHLLINHLQQHERNTYWQHMAGKPHTVLLQERVPGPNTPHFKLHLRPGRPSQPGNKYGHKISRAGEAPGLQVAPGSVTEVEFTTAQQVVISRYTSKIQLSIPMVLAFSQLPPTGSRGVNLTVEGQGQWQVNLQYSRRDKHVTVQLSINHPLSAFAGCPISKMALSQDKKLTLTLAPAAAAAAATTAGQAASPAAAAAAAPPSPVFTQSPDQPAAPAAAGETAVGAHTPNAALQAARDAAGQGLPLPTAATAGAAAPLGSLARCGTPSAAVAASGRTLSVLPLKRRTGGIAEPGSGQQQPESGSTAAAGMVVTAAAAAAAGTSMKPVKAHGHKKIKPAGQQTPAVTARVGGTEGTGAVAVAAPGGTPAPAPSTPAAATQAHTPTNMASIKREAPAGLSAQLEAPDNAVEQAAQQAAAATALASTLAARAGTPRAAPAAAKGPTPPPVTPVPIKVEAPEVMDLTAVDDQCIAALPSAAPAAAAAATTVAPAAAGSLPAGLQLLPASTPADIEFQLVKVLSEGLMPLLPPQQYDSIMQQLSGLFAPGRRPAIDWVRLRCRYAYVQAAVWGGRLSRVVEELQALIKACL